MILRIKVPDEVYEAFGQVNPKNPRAVMEALLELEAGRDPSKKSITLTGEALAALQHMTGTSLDAPADLVEAVRRALTVQVGGVSVELDAGQRKRLILQAAQWKREPEEYIADRIRDNLRSL